MDNSDSYFYREESTVQEMVEGFEPRLQAKFQKLEKCWDELCSDNEEKLSYCATALGHLSSMLNQMVSESNSTLKSKKREVEELKVTLRALYRDMGDEPIEPELSGGIAHQTELLSNLVQALTERKQKRMAKYRSLKELYDGLCAVLDTYPETFHDNVIPSEEKMISLQTQITKLKDLKEERCQKYAGYKHNIVELLDELEIQPNNRFEEIVVYDEIEDFTLSSYNMDLLKTYHDQLMAKLKKAKAEADELRANVKEMWTRIPLHEAKSDDFFNDLSDCKSNTIHALKAELERCRRVRLANLHKIIQDSRREIREWWIKCYYNAEQCAEFTPFKSCDFTEELLEDHDRELTRIKRFYSDHEALFNNINKRQELFKRYLELEKSATDPNRFSNRGGKLLQEEKERKRLAVELPQVERRLEGEVLEWEQATGRKFLLEGMTFKEFIMNTWAEQERKKQAEKDLRTHLKKTQTQKETFFGTKASAVKRRVPGTPGGLGMSTIHTSTAMESGAGPAIKRGRIEESRLQSTLRPLPPSNSSRLQNSKLNNKSITNRNRRRSDRLLKQATAMCAKKSAIPAPNSSRFGFGGGIVVERGGPAIKPLRLVNRILASTPADLDETLQASTVAGPRMIDSGIDCTVGSVGPYREFTLSVKSSDDKDSTRWENLGSFVF